MQEEETHMINQLCKIQFFECYFVLKKVFFSSFHPPCISLIFVRNNLRLIGIWRRSSADESKYYDLYNLIIIAAIFLLMLNIFWHLYEEGSKNLVVFGDDLVILLGLALILFKIFFYRNNCNEVDKILLKLNQMHKMFANWPGDKHKILAWQRIYFLGEIVPFFLYFAMATFFWMAICAPPLLTSQSLPFGAIYPFNWHDAQVHSVMHALIYIYQCICCAYCLVGIILMDEGGVHLLSQITVNFRILGWQLRQLGLHETAAYSMYEQLRDIVQFHQKLIELSEHIMHVFYWSYVAQMCSSTLMICLTAYETLMMHDQPMEAIKFLVYMMLAFSQIFYWCFVGNKVHDSSLDIANAGFEVHKWYKQNKEFQNNLMFLIQRAQKPLIFSSKPFPGFTFKSFASIISTSYTYFTLLRIMSYEKD